MNWQKKTKPKFVHNYNNKLIIARFCEYMLIICVILYCYKLYYNYDDDSTVLSVRILLCSCVSLDA